MKHLTNITQKPLLFNIFVHIIVYDAMRYIQVLTKRFYDFYFASKQDFEFAQSTRNSLRSDSRGALANSKILFWQNNEISAMLCLHLYIPHGCLFIIEKIDRLSTSTMSLKK